MMILTVENKFNYDIVNQSSIAPSFRAGNKESLNLGALALHRAVY